MPQQPHQPQGQTISSPLVNDACITGEPAAIAEQWFQKAVQLQTDGHVKDALNCYQRALRYAPEMAEAYYNMGLIYAEQKDWAQSMIQLKKVLELKPDFVDAAFQLAVALHASGQYQQARL